MPQDPAPLLIVLAAALTGALVWAGLLRAAARSGRKTDQTARLLRDRS